MTQPLSSVLELIGRTPLVDLTTVCGTSCRILAKAEFLNPGGSIKDRAALWIIQLARRAEVLKAGQPVVEMTSGNMGAGLAIVCRQFGHPFTAVMSEGNSSARAAIMKAFGAEVQLVPQRDGQIGEVTGNDVAAAEEVARNVADELDGYYVDQFCNPGSVLAHYESTGPEIERDAPEIAAFVSVVGSAGTFVGTARYLKERKSNILCAAVEPAGSAVLSGHQIASPRHLLQGTGYGFVPPHWDPTLMDLALSVTDNEAIEWRRRLGLAGYYVGFSAAANVCAAARLAQSGRLTTGGVIVTILCDTGLKY